MLNEELNVINIFSSDLIQSAISNTKAICIIVKHFNKPCNIVRGGDVMHRVCRISRILCPERPTIDSIRITVPSVPF